MRDLYGLTDNQLARMKPFFPLSHGVPRVDDRRVPSGWRRIRKQAGGSIFPTNAFSNRNGSRWRDAPSADGPCKTLYNRFVRWSRLGVFALMLTELAQEGQDTALLRIDATHLKAHRTAPSLRGKKGGLASRPAA